MQAILALLLAAVLHVAPVNAQNAADIARARPDAAETAAIHALGASALTAIISGHLVEAKTFEIAGCEIVYPHKPLPDWNPLEIRIDTRQVIEGGWERDGNVLLYHPRTKGRHIKILKGREPSESEFHSLWIKDSSPGNYWQVKLAFEALAKKVAADCK